MLNLVAISQNALPRGGDVEVEMQGALENPAFHIKCSGKGARKPQHLSEFISQTDMPEIDAMSVQAYYTWRLAKEAGMTLNVETDGDTVIIAAR